MSEINVIISDNPSISASVSEDRVTTTSNLSNPLSLESITLIGDVDATNKTNGSILVYNQSTNRWTSTTTLNAQNMEGGEF